MPSTACYYAANLGDNPCKLVTDTLIPVHGLQGLFFGVLFLVVFFVFFFVLFCFFTFAAAILASILLSCELWEEEKSVLLALNLSPVRRWNKNFYLPFYHNSSFFFLFSPLVWCPWKERRCTWSGELRQLAQHSSLFFSIKTHGHSNVWRSIRAWIVVLKCQGINKQRKHHSLRE